jgi:hypothetical protein
MQAMSGIFLNVDLLPVKIVQLSKSKDFLLHLLCFCFFHNIVAIVLEMEHRSIEPVEWEEKTTNLVTRYTNTVL